LQGSGQGVEHLGEKWHVALTEYRREIHAFEALRSRYPEEKIFLPRRVEQRRDRNRAYAISVPLISMYIFIRFDPDAKAGERWERINETKGIQGLLCGASLRPRSISDVVMTAFIKTCGANRGGMDLERVKRAFVGRLARIKPNETHGAFVGHSGMCEWSDGTDADLVIWILGSSQKLRFPVAVLEAA
jgi:hypothetical protein